MSFETWGLVAMSVLVLDLWAISSIIGAAREAHTKIIWIAIVLLFPAFGFLAWAVAGPKSVRIDGE